MPNAKSHLNELLDDLILSILELKMVLTRTDVIEFFQKYTLLGIQEGENLDLDKIIDEFGQRSGRNQHFFYSVSDIFHIGSNPITF